MVKTTDEIYNQKPYQNQVINQVVEMTFGWLKINRDEKHHNEELDKLQNEKKAEDISNWIKLAKINEKTDYYKSKLSTQS